MPYELFVAIRYLVARRKQAFISLISLISTIGVAVGVMALIIALALMTGLQGELRDRIVGSAPHVYVLMRGGVRDLQAEMRKLRQVPRVVGAAPAILGKALITSEGGEAFINLKGIDPQLERSVTEIDRAMRAGRLDGLAQASADGLRGIVLGEALAKQLNVTVGDSVTVLTPQGTLSPVGMMPRPRRLRVAGVFALGLFEFDSEYGFVGMDVAERLLGRAGPDFIQLRVDNIYAAPEVAEAVTRRFGAGYLAQDWAAMNQSLFSALWLEKIAMAITIGLIVMVAALNIVASLVLLVMEKSRDIAILKTMGASKQSITWIFVLQGLVIGLVGTLAGGLGGWTLTQVLDRYKLIRIPMDVYQVSYMPFKIQPFDLAVVIVASILICFLATIYPSRQASRLDPAEALRYS